MVSSLHVVATTTQLSSAEAEFAKDAWDLRCIPGARYDAHRSCFFVNFTPLPEGFRPLCKRYMRLLVAQHAQSYCRQKVQNFRRFFEFFLKRSPNTFHFQHLSRTDMEAYLIYLKTEPNDHGKLRHAATIGYAMVAIKQLLEYLEQTSAPEAPLVPVAKLIWQSDIVKKPSYYRGEVKVKYIPENVLQQLDQHIHHLSPVSLPVVIVLRASGWRISDVLNLRYDTCLERTSSGWWLRGDIQKTGVLNHRVPITEEIAALVAAQQTLVKEPGRVENNPQRYLFPASTKKRLGLPVHAQVIQYALDRLAEKCEIKDEAGNIFHFKTHAFRHTKAVELINNGMSLFHVQKWMAHLSPEMTMVYAQLLDPTMRRAWEEAFAKGAVRIDVAGTPQKVSSEQLAQEQDIEWEHIRHNLDAVRLADGYCFKPKKANCPTQDSPCYTCHHFCTTPDFLSQFERQERDLRELIELGEKSGSAIWVERNTQKLSRMLPVIQVLRKGDLHHPAGKTMREYTPAERAKNKHDR
jgi:integrase